MLKAKVMYEYYRGYYLRTNIFGECFVSGYDKDGFEYDFENNFKTREDAKEFIDQMIYENIEE